VGVATLADVGSSAAAAVGAPGFRDALGIGACRQVVVCLVDGLGWDALHAHRTLAPRLAALSGGPIDAVFPTTTPVGLASLGTGLLPGMHGLVGAAFRYPESDELLMPLHWGREPVPVAVQPEPTVFERVAQSGIRMTTVSPGAYRDSGLTRAVLRGADYLAADDAEQRILAVRDILGAGRVSFTYVYWPELDRIGHEFGVASEEWRAALARVDELVGGLADELVPGSALVVTADHGMLDCPPETRIAIEEDPRLTANVDRIAGEPRARHLYVANGSAAEVQAAWRESLGTRADVFTRSELVDSGLLGPVDAELADRIGDVMVIARTGTLLASRFDSMVSQLLGQHGGLSPAEVRIPALIQRRD
jgi:hypothetical protein